jgi:WD40 repeat protein
MDHTYNRPGEVILLEFAGESACCSILDGHSQTDNNGITTRSTVTSVAYDQHYGSFVSAGYDGIISFWKREDSSLKAMTITTGSSPVNCLTISTEHPLLACGTQDGHLHVARYSLDHNTGHMRKSNLLADKSHRKWANSVDCAVFGQDTVYAATGYHEKCNSGQVVCYDFGKDVVVPLFTAQTGISCLDYGPAEPILAVGTGNVIDGSLGSGDYFIIDRRAKSSVSVVQTGQLDMDCVKFSPCGRYIVSSDTSDNSVVVSDIRTVGRPWIVKYNHGKPGCEGIMGIHWLKDGKLASGGADGMVKLYDLNKLSHPFKELYIGHHINSIVTSSDDSTLFVGTDFGTVHVFSQNPAIAHTISSNCTSRFV